MEDEIQRRSSIRVGDEDRLAELGYKQELTRNWSLLHNFGVSFSIIVSEEPFLLQCHTSRFSQRFLDQFELGNVPGPVVIACSHVYPMSRDVGG